MLISERESLRIATAVQRFQSFAADSWSSAPGHEAVIESAHDSGKPRPLHECCSEPARVTMKADRYSLTSTEKPSASQVASSSLTTTPRRSESFGIDYEVSSQRIHVDLRAAFDQTGDTFTVALRCCLRVGASIPLSPHQGVYGTSTIETRTPS